MGWGIFRTLAQHKRNIFVLFKKYPETHCGTIGTDCLINVFDGVVATTLEVSDSNRRTAGSFLVKNDPLEIRVVLCTRQNTHSFVWPWGTKNLMPIRAASVSKQQLQPPRWYITHASGEHQVKRSCRELLSALLTVSAGLTWVNSEMYPLQGHVPPHLRPLYMMFPWHEMQMPFHHLHSVKIAFENPLGIQPVVSQGVQSHQLDSFAAALFTH